MLPRIHEAHREVPYHTFSQELLSRDNSQNNFTKLKLMKEFLDDDGHEPSEEQVQLPSRKKVSSECKARSGSQLQVLKPLKVSSNKENQLKTTKVMHRPAFTIDLSMKIKTQNEISALVNENSIFAIPDRFKLNDVILVGAKGRRNCRYPIGNTLSVKGKTEMPRIL